jgi:pimeloyl-ACP methyl ester carboxylesterase
VSGLVAVAPAADGFRVYCSVLGLAARDFDEAGDERADAIRSCLRETTRVMDEPMLQAFALAAADERIFDHYWVNSAAQGRAADAYGGRFAVDGESLVSVLCDYRERHEALHTSAPVRQPVLAIFGESDIVSPRAEHLPALEAIAPQTEAITVPGTGHYVHLEAPVTVIEVIEDWIVRTRRPARDVARNDA